MTDTDLDLTIRCQRDGSYAASLHMRRPNYDADLAVDRPVCLDHTALLEYSLDPHAYGRALTAMLFADAELRQAWAQAVGFGQRQTTPLRLRLRLDPTDESLHALRWETLYDPQSDAPLCVGEQILFSRYLGSRDLSDIQASHRPDLKALVMVANPTDLDDYQLAPVDVDGEVVRCCAALGNIPITTVADTGDGQHATLNALVAALRDGYHILYLVCHGRHVKEKGKTYLWFEQEDGTSDTVDGAALVESLQHLAHRPLLIVLAACQSAGTSHDAGVLAALGPTLARAGIAAVLAMQGNVRMQTVRQMLPVFFSEVCRDGQVDRALAAARAAMQRAADWWLPVLFLRIRDGRLWREGDQRAVERRTRLRALLHDHTSFMQDRLASFVGRKHELTEIRARIAALNPEGGYVTITGQAGQGKSSVIAKLVEEYGPENVAYHFIPFNPGPDHQVGLLRNLMARLILKYDLTDIYVASESRPALRDYFPRVLAEIANKGGQEVIFIDGLDQIQEDTNGERDLSFLPTTPPAGIVFVLGTRPNDTLKPLELRKPRYEYWLPDLSRGDFDLILQHRGVTLDAHLADRFYSAMQQNALYLDLVAKVLAETPDVRDKEIIDQIADDPDNLFAFLIGENGYLTTRWKDWERAGWPILSILLAARQPLSAQALQELVGISLLTTRSALQKLGDVIARDGEGRAFLYHLKFQDYLRHQVFSPAEMTECHQHLAAWCERGGLDRIWEDTRDAAEQERRAYVRQHYMAHLADAKNWERLWEVLDTGDYGRAKIRHDPSMRSYARDLDIGRQAVIDAAGEDCMTQVQLLPRLWKYSLLRCSLISQVDQYPDVLFTALVSQGRGNEAVETAELLTDTDHKVTILGQIGVAFVEQGQVADGTQMLYRVLSLVESDYVCTTVLQNLATAFTRARQWDAARVAANAIPDEEDRVAALRDLVTALTRAGHDLQTADAFAAARAAADAIESDSARTRALRELAIALSNAGQWDAARSAADTISYTDDRAAALRELATALTCAGHNAQAADTFAAARTIADAIESDNNRTRALRDLATALTSAGQWDAARAVADAIPQREDRTAALRDLATALTSAGQWDAARTTASAIPDEYNRTAAFGAIAESIDDKEQFQTYFKLLMSLWKQAETRKELLELFSLVSHALRQHPEIVGELLSGFTWADEFL